MRKTVLREPLQEELTLAIGLVWGHLNAGQFKQASQLARGCLRVWPEEMRLSVMVAFAAIEMGQPLEATWRSALMNADCAEWTALVLCRAEGVHAAMS